MMGDWSEQYEERAKELETIAVRTIEPLNIPIWLTDKAQLNGAADDIRTLVDGIKQLERENEKLKRENKEYWEELHPNYGLSDILS